MQDSRLGSVVFCEYPSFFITFPFYSPYYAGFLRFVRELGFDALPFAVWVFARVRYPGILIVQVLFTSQGSLVDRIYRTTMPSVPCGVRWLACLLVDRASQGSSVDPFVGHCTLIHSRVHWLGLFVGQPCPHTF